MTDRRGFFSGNAVRGGSELGSRITNPTPIRPLTAIPVPPTNPPPAPQYPISLHPRARARQVDIISSLSETTTMTTTTSEPTISRNAIPFPLCESRWEEDRSQWQREELGSREYLAFVESRLLGVNSSHSPTFSAELRKKSNQKSQYYLRPLASRCRSEARMRRGGGGRSPFLPFCQKCRGGASKSAIDKKFDLLRPWNALLPFYYRASRKLFGEGGGHCSSSLQRWRVLSLVPKLHVRIGTDNSH